MLKVRTRFPRAWWICSNIALEVGFTELLGLVVIPYYVSIRYFLNSCQINPDPCSYLISIGLGCLDSHVVSTKFANCYWFYHYIVLFQNTLLQVLEYESEVNEREKLLKFYRARSTLSYTRVWSRYRSRIFIKLTEDVKPMKTLKLTEDVKPTKTSETKVSLN